MSKFHRLRRALAVSAVAPLALFGLGVPATAALGTVSTMDVDPSVTVDPSELAVGDSFTLSGEGFTPGSTVEGQTLDADGNVVGEDSVEADGNGEVLEEDLVVPDAVSPGEHTVVLTDTSGATAQADVTILADGDKGGAGSGEDGDGAGLPDTGPQGAILGGVVALAMIAGGAALLRIRRGSVNHV